MSAWDLEWASMQVRPPARPRRRKCGDLMATAVGWEGGRVPVLPAAAGQCHHLILPFLSLSDKLPSPETALRASMCKESRGKGSAGEGKRQPAAGWEAPTCGSGAEASRPVPLRCDTGLPDLAWWRVRWARGTNGLEVEDSNFPGPQPAHSPLPRSAVPAKPRDSSLDR